MKTRLFIDIQIDFDSEESKEQGLKFFSEHLRVGKKVRGSSKDGGYELQVLGINEMLIRKYKDTIA